MFNNGKLHPRESLRDSLANLRSIQYSAISIKEKESETEKLSNHLDIERQKIEKAYSSLERDRDRFKTLEAKEDQELHEITQKRLELVDHRKKLQSSIDELNEQLQQLDRQVKIHDEKLDKELFNK